MSKIAVIGSINMDVVNYVKKHPLLGETIYGLGTAYSPGGKGANQAVAAAMAGGDVTMIGAVGQDPFGSELIASLRRYGVRTESILTKEETSGIAFITVDASGENNIILSQGANGKLTASDIDASLHALEGVKAVLLQNEIPWETTRYAIHQVRKKGIRVYWNPTPAIKLDTDDLSLIDVIVLNETEAEEITGLSVQVEEQAKLVAKQIINAGAHTVVVTLGDRGSLFVNRDGELIRTQAFNVKEVIDTTAAGDTFIGAFVVANESGFPTEESLAFASAAAAISVTKKGAQASIPSRGEIEHFLSECLF